MRKQREQGRRARQRADVATVALVGYTNAGKSTLFNALTRAHVLAEDRLFATLDPTLRKLELPGLGDVVLADTVGFIRQLPHSLVEAFKATLEEVSQADLLLHVIDAKMHGDEERAEQVRAVLAEIGADRQPILEVYNKIDLVNEPARIERGAHGEPIAVWLSAQRGDGIDLLVEAITERLGVDSPHAVRDSCRRLREKPARGSMKWVPCSTNTQPDDGGTELTVRLNAQSRARLAMLPGVLLPGSQGVHRISPSPGP